MEITFERFVELVANMRHNQRRYFATRRPEVLETSKRLEKEVDEAVAEIVGHQKKLF